MTAAHTAINPGIAYKIELPVRRYAIFNDLLRGQYAIVVRGIDIETAPKWAGFVCWLGALKKPEVREVRCAALAKAKGQP